MEAISKRFGEMSIKRGNKFTFPGMDIKITYYGRVKIGMKEYIQGSIYMFGGYVS